MMAAILSIDEQVAEMKATWPQFAARRIDRSAQSARWIGSVTPQYARYSLEIRYELGSFPEVRVLTPELSDCLAILRGNCRMSTRQPRIRPFACSTPVKGNGHRR
jgi:hypothetical protein